MLHKICSRCKKGKPVSDFFKDKYKKSGLTSACKVCKKNSHAVWKSRNKQKVMQTSRKNNYKRQYGITIDDWNEMFEEQQGRCAICDKHQSNEPMRLHVDHNHTTGQVRELLCSNCNRMLGCAKEDTEILEKAINYLNKHDSV
jgi:hypothetical protein